MIRGKPLRVLQAQVAAQYPTLKDVRVNPAVVRGATLFERFTAAVESAGARCSVELLLHGTPEENVDSILTSPLRGWARSQLRYFSNCEATAAAYARGAPRQVIFAVLNPAKQPIYGSKAIFTISEEAHHLPLFVARRG
jgi:hypothetical protein